MTTVLNKREWSLKKETEIRCEVADGATLRIKLLTGTAEIFGVELAPNKEYTFRDQNVAIFTWYGCTLESSGDDAGLYIADSTPMIAYVNTHVQLEARRDVAVANKDAGPRVLLVGPADHGKSTTAQILAAYAVRLDRTPLYVDLDVGQGAIGIPGCISAVPLEKSSLCVEEGFTNITPLVYFFGHNSPKENVDLYNDMISHLGQKINDRLKRDVDANAAGSIVNTCGWVDQDGYASIMHCIKALGIDVVLVMNQDKLYSMLKSTLDREIQTDNANGGATSSDGTTAVFTASGINKGVVVVKLPRSGGVVQRDTTTRKRLRKSRIREYFYGRMESPSSTKFSPERREAVQISAFTFLKVVAVKLSEGMKVVGSDTSQDASWRLMKVPLTADLTYSVVAVLHPLDDNGKAIDMSSATNSSSSSSSVDQSLVRCNVAGFVSIVQIDAERDVMTLLCPCPGTLPSSTLLIGSVKWME